MLEEHAKCKTASAGVAVKIGHGAFLLANWGHCGTPIAFMCSCSLLTCRVQKKVKDTVGTKALDMILWQAHCTVQTKY
jgi:hypothetical protein